MLDRAAKISRTQVTKMRWVLGLHGLASVVFGVMILAWPGISVYALTIVFGAYTLATGIVEFGTAFTTQGKEERALAHPERPSRDHRRRARLRLAGNLGAHAPVRDRRLCRCVRESCSSARRSGFHWTVATRRR